MTEPVQIGYPDYGRYSAQQDIIILNVSNADLDAPQTFPIQPVGHVPYLYILLSAVTNHIRLNIDWFADAGGTIIVQSQEVMVRQNGLFDGPLPNLGPFIQVTVSASAINSEYALFIMATHQPKRTPNAGAVGNLLLRVANQSIGAGATRTDNIDLVVPGPATWSVDTSVVDWFSEIEAIDQAGVTYLIDRLEEKAGNQRRLIFLPPCSVRVRTGNNTGAAANFFITVGVPPFHDIA